MRSIILAAGLMLAAISGTGIAQDNNSMGEVVVTAQRSSKDYYSDEQPVIGLRRQADSAVQGISITSDSRDEAVRKNEIHAMLLAAIDRANAAGVQLVSGNFELVTVTKDNFRDLAFQNAGRPDTSKVDLMVKAKLSGSTGSAQRRIDDFVRAVPPSGRSLMEKHGALTLTIINPDQYRDEIVKLVAEAAKKNASYFGADYGAEVTGLNAQLEWAQVSNTEVFLYIPYRFTIRPK